MSAQLIITAPLLLRVMVFAVQNSRVVEIQLLFWRVEFPRSLLVFMMLLVGIVIGWVGSTMGRLSK